MGEWSCGHFPTGERLTPTDLTECPSISSALTHFWVICCIATFISLVFWSFFPLTNPYFKPSCLVWVESGQVQQLLGLMIATMTMGGDYRPSAGDINSLPRHLLRFLFVEPKYPGAGFAHLYFWNLIIGTILIDKILMHDYQHNNDRNNFDV